MDFPLSAPPVLVLFFGFKPAAAAVLFLSERTEICYHHARLSPLVKKSGFACLFRSFAFPLEMVPINFLFSFVFFHYFFFNSLGVLVFLEPVV